MDEEESLPENVSGFLLESSLLSLEGFRGVCPAASLGRLRPFGVPGFRHALSTERDKGHPDHLPIFELEVSGIFGVPSPPPEPAMRTRGHWDVHRLRSVQLSSSLRNRTAVS
jgi:hypothetical protein